MAERMTAAERRSQLVEIAKQVFAELGYDGASVEEIASRAGVSKPVVYEHFGGKQGVYAVVVDREVTRLLEKITSRLSPLAGGRAQLYASAMAFLDYIAEDPDGFRVVTRDSPSTFSGGGMGALLEDVADEATEVLTRFFTRSGIPLEGAPVYARAMVGMIAYVGAWWAETHEPPKEEVAAHVVSLLYNGLARLPADPMEGFRLDLDGRSRVEEPSS